jgi:hypothetical protein
MKRKALGVMFAVTMILGLGGATPAWARSDATLTVTCTGGQVIVSDAHSLTGQTAATTAYNAVNPFGEVCTVHS